MEETFTNAFPELAFSCLLVDISYVIFRAFLFWNVRQMELLTGETARCARILLVPNSVMPSTYNMILVPTKLQTQSHCSFILLIFTCFRHRS